MWRLWFSLLFVGFTSNSVSNQYTFKLEKAPKEIGFYKARNYWGAQTNKEGKRTLQLMDFKHVAYLKLYEDSTILFFQTNLTGDSLKRKYNFYSDSGLVYRGRLQRGKGNNYSFEAKGKWKKYIGYFYHQFNQLDSNRTGLKLSYFTLNGELKETYSGVQPWIVTPDGMDKRLEFFPVQVYDQLGALSSEIQKELIKKLPDNN